MRQLGWVAVLVCACTASNEVGPDAGSGSDPTDAGVDDVDSGSSDAGLDDDVLAATDVRVIVKDGYAPIANVRVLFDATGGTLKEIATDASGKATAAMPDGGNITVIRTYAASTPQRYPEIYSYVGVKPGDQLHVGHVIDRSTTPTTINVRVPNVAQGTVKIVSLCGSGQGTAPNISLSVVACPPNVTFFVSDARAWSFVATRPYSTNIDLSPEPVNEPLSTTVLTYDVTPDLSSVTAEGRAVSGMRALYSTGVKRVDQQSTQIAMPNLTFAIDELVIGTRVATAGGTQVMATRLLYAPMPVSVDASGDVIPYLEQPANYAPDTVTWVEQGTGMVDAVIASIEVTRGDPGAPATDTKYTRTIIAPHATTSLAIPQLTGADATYNPVTADQLAGAVGLLHSSAGYDGLRPWAFGVSNVVEAVPKGESVTLSFATGHAPTLAP